MESEVLKKLESIENRLGKLEALSVAMTQKLVAVQNSAIPQSTGPIVGAMKVRLPEDVSEMILLLIAYIVGYVLYGYLGMISAGTSFLLLALVSASGLYAAFRKSSENISLFVVATAFLVPYLFGLRAATDFAYFVYVLTLNVGLISISFMKRWRLLAFVGFVGTVVDLTVWYGLYYSPDKIAISLYAIGVFYLMYLAVAVFNEIAHGFKSYRLDVIVLIANPVWFILGLRYLLGSENNIAFIVITIATCAFYIALAMFHLIFKHQKRPELI